jgi:hypothetical protein
MSKKEGSTTKSVDKTRRHFFSHLMAETIAMFQEIQGKPQMRLNDLYQVPEHVIRKMVPVFNRNSSFRIDGDRLLVQYKKRGVFEEICRLDRMDIYILRCFEGHCTLEEIGESVEGEFGQESGVAYQKVKSLFLVLAKHTICHPAHAHDQDVKEASP